MSKWIIDDVKIYEADIETKIDILLAVFLVKHMGGIAITEDFNPLFDRLKEGGYLRKEEDK